MEGSSKASTAPSGTGNAVSSGSSGSGTPSSTVDNSDVYEFKSSKEATPVRGSSLSPNPEKEKDVKSSGNQSQSGNSGANGGSASTSGEASTSSGYEDVAIDTSTASKRPFEADNADDQDEENRKKKRKDVENPKDNPKGSVSGRQNIGRNNANTGEKVVDFFIFIFSGGHLPNYK